MSAIFSIISLVLALACYVISQLQQHGQLKWMNLGLPFSFWGTKGYVRKYKELSREKGESFRFSTTLLVFLTDGYHFMQFMFFNFLALSLTLGIGWNWYLFCSLLIGIRIVHWAARKLLSK